MDWANERYVRVYVRDTGDWLMWPWQTRALLVFLFRKVDRSGVLKLGKGKLRALAAIVGMPVDEVAAALEPLLEDGCVQMGEDELVIPNFLEAQETPQSDKLRKQASRERTRADAIASVGHTESRAVTPGHAESQSVTLSRAVPCLAMPSCAVQGADSTAQDLESEPEEDERPSEVRILTPVPPPRDPDIETVARAIREDRKFSDLDAFDIAQRAMPVGARKPLPWLLTAVQEAGRDTVQGEQAHARQKRLASYLAHARAPREPVDKPKTETRIVSVTYHGKGNAPLVANMDGIGRGPK